MNSYKADAIAALGLNEITDYFDNGYVKTVGYEGSCTECGEGIIFADSEFYKYCGKKTVYKDDTTVTYTLLCDECMEKHKNVPYGPGSYKKEDALKALQLQPITPDYQTTYYVITCRKCGKTRFLYDEDFYKHVMFDPKENKFFVLCNDCLGSKDRSRDGLEEKDKDNNQTYKKDAGKIRPSLVPTAAIKAIAEVRMYGEKKYGDAENWRKVEPIRYLDALYRHLLEMIDEPQGKDIESGIEHYKHLACDAAFLCELFEEK